MQEMNASLLTLLDDYNALSRRGVIRRDIPDYVTNNLNPRFAIREYQKEGI